MLCGIFLAALALRLMYIFLVPHEPEPPMDDRHYYFITAQHILEGKGIMQLRSFAYQPPLFPALEAGVFAVFGLNNTLAVEVMLALFSALQCVLLALWASSLATRRVGYIAGAWAALYPQFIRYPQTRYSEAFYMFMLALGIWLVVRALQNGSWRRFLLAGAVCGLGALTREASVFLLPIVAGWFWLGHKSLPPNLANSFLVFAAGMILVIAPWTVRNWFVLNAFVPISTNGGVNFYMGNNPDADGRFVWKLAPGVDWQDGANEVFANKQGFREGLKYVAENPGRTVQMWFKKAWYLWEPPSLAKSTSNLELVFRLGWLVFYLAMAVLAVYGFLRLGAAWRSVSFVLLTIVFMSLPYIATYATSRYRLPMESVLLFYSALGVEFLLRRYREGDDTSPVPAKLFS
jgi:4-amino-4-deoxy-L-arabinose transferase-like glycosyltransferase